MTDATLSDDPAYRAGTFMGRMRTLREVMARLNEKSDLDPGNPLAIYADIEARHHALHRWVMQSVQECETEMEVFRQEQSDDDEA